uniref:Uncharacterized protein n=1 Tax=Octactis speculum TaxID=3111310 RepID=A0A7S2G7V4_9STRA
MMRPCDLAEVSADCQAAHVARGKYNHELQAGYSTAGSRGARSTGHENSKNVAWGWFAPDRAFRLSPLSSSSMPQPPFGPTGNRVLVLLVIFIFFAVQIPSSSLLGS